MRRIREAATTTTTRTGWPLSYAGTPKTCTTTPAASPRRHDVMRAVVEWDRQHVPWNRRLDLPDYTG